jgi:hypothetical protein
MISRSVSAVRPWAICASNALGVISCIWEQRGPFVPIESTVVAGVHFLGEFEIPSHFETPPSLGNFGRDSGSE